MMSEWKGDVPTLELLTSIAAAPLPLGLRSGPVESFFQRDIYFDSAEWALGRRGVGGRFGIRLDDRRVLTLRTTPRLNDAAALVLPQTFEADVPDLEGEQALAGTSDPARRLRSLIDPALLMPRIQFETERRLRRTVARWFARGRFEVLYDVATVRSQRRARTFQELRIRQLAAGRPGLEAIAEAFRERYELRTLLVPKVDRADKVLRDLDSGTLAEDVHGNREVALIVVDGESVAMLAEATTLTLPIRGGNGEDVGPVLLRMFFGSAAGQLRFLGTAPGGASRPVLEVWMARWVTVGLAQE